MKHKNQIKASIEKNAETPEVVEFIAFMGNRSGTVKKDKKNNVYVVDQNGNVMVVKNLRNIPHVSKLPVIVGIDPSEPGIMQVLRQRNAYHNPPYPNVAEHAEIMHARWGSDPVWVNKQQILDLLPYPASATGMIVQLRGGKYYLNGDHVLPNQTIDFSAEIPASGACWVLAEVDESKVITLRAGSTLASREVLTPEDIPAPATDQKRLFAVKCYYGQTRIVQTKTVEDIYILHDVPGEGGGGTVPDHNDLGGLQGGTAAEYYHLTAAQHTGLTGGGSTILHTHNYDLGTSFQIDSSGGTSDTYGVLSGTINGSNKVFTVSLGSYISGALQLYLNGQLLTQGASEDWTETTPGSGTFTLTNAPVSGDVLIAIYKFISATSGNADTLDGYEAETFLDMPRAVRGTVDVDFGVGDLQKSVTVSNALATVSSYITATILCKATTSNRADEIMAQPFDVKIKNQTSGAFDIVVTSLIGKAMQEIPVSYILMN